jgi:membrane-bound metal-dependent hydrolase YbcI (DUF457 family)
MKIVMNTRTQVVLGLAVIASVIGAIVLALAGRSTPGVIVALGLAVVSSLAGSLAPSPWNRPVE